MEETKQVFRAEPDACVAAIREVNEDDTLWAEMASTSLLPGNKVEESIFDINRERHNLHDVLCTFGSYLCGDLSRAVRHEK